MLDLSNNKLSTRMPSNLGRLLGFQILGSSQLSGDTLYEEVQVDIKGFEYSLTYVLLANTIFDLSNNNFIGEIPPNMGSLSALRLLNLSRNQLQGKIPASLSEISTLEQLDLAKNNLSGEIPRELSKLTKLASLDVSFNKLCGRIPEGTQLDTFNMTSFQRNLCGYPLQACNETKINKKRGDGAPINVSKSWRWLNLVDEHVSLIALSVGLAIGFGKVVTMIIMWKKAWYWMVPQKIEFMKYINFLNNLNFYLPITVFS
jgi:Leucine-rich repeat (LRR) protein